MCVSLVYQSWQKIGVFRHSGAFVQKPFTLFQVIAVDADPRNLAYLRTSLDLNNSTNNVRILYNAVRLEWNTTWQSTDETDPHRHRYLKWIIVTLIHQQRGGHPLPNDPRPEQRGCCPYVHRGAPPCRKPPSDLVHSIQFRRYCFQATLPPVESITMAEILVGELFLFSWIKIFSLRRL